MNITNNMGYIQNILTSNKPKNISEGSALQNVEQHEMFDKLELSPKAVEKSKLINVPQEIEVEIPRTWTISVETLDSRVKHTQGSLKKADSLNLSFGERLEFLKADGMAWVEGIRKTDPEMFGQWLKMNKENIQNGRSDLAGLPSGFTMKDYYSFVKEPFSAIV